MINEAIEKEVISSSLFLARKSITPFLQLTPRHIIVHADGPGHTEKGAEVRDYFSDPTKRLMADTVKAIEQKSSAEIVVALRRHSGSYRAIDLSCGVAFAFVALLLVLFLPWEFALEAIPLEVATAFAFGFLFSSRSRWLRRLLSSSKTRASQVATHARCTFFDLGVSKTKSRSGILVYLSILEKHVEIVSDCGIDPGKLGPDWDKLKIELQKQFKTGKPEAFAQQLLKMGDLLAGVYPRAADDENELADEVNAS